MNFFICYTYLKSHLKFKKLHAAGEIVDNLKRELQFSF